MNDHQQAGEITVNQQVRGHESPAQFAEFTYLCKPRQLLDRQTCMPTDFTLSSSASEFMLGGPFVVVRIRPYLDFKTANTIATSIIHSKLDYCNSLCFNLPNCLLYTSDAADE